MSEEGRAFLSWVGQAAVVGIGWYVVHRLTANRDRDKARVDSIKDALEALSDDASALLLEARAYHLAARDVQKELHIKMTIQDLAIRLNALSDIHADTPAFALCRSHILSMRKTITGAHFDDEHTGPLSDADPQFELMAAAVLELKRSLLKVRNSLLL